MLGAREVRRIGFQSGTISFFGMPANRELESTWVGKKVLEESRIVDAPSGRCVTRNGLAYSLAILDATDVGWKAYR